MQAWLCDLCLKELCASILTVWGVNTQVLAKKMIAIMELSQQQLSKQDHYDYGLRSFVIPIARAAGNIFLFCHVYTLLATCYEHAYAGFEAIPCHATRQRIDY